MEKRCSDRVAAEQERCAAVSAELAAAKTQIEQAGAGLEAATRLVFSCCFCKKLSSSERDDSVLKCCVPEMEEEVEGFSTNLG